MAVIYVDSESIYVDSVAYYVDGSIVMIDISQTTTTWNKVKH